MDEREERDGGVACYVGDVGSKPSMMAHTYNGMGEAWEEDQKFKVSLCNTDTSRPT